MPTTFECEMMMRCCRADGHLDFERMQSFMQECGKRIFSNEELGRMKSFCQFESPPEFERLHRFLESCHCPGV